MDGDRPEPEVVRFAAAGPSGAERFEHWRSWHSAAVHGATSIERAGAVPDDFGASAQQLTCGRVQLVALENGPASGGWTLGATEAVDVIRVAAFRRAPELRAHWNGADVHGPAAAGVWYRGPGWWRAPQGLDAVQVNVDRGCLPLSEAELEKATATVAPPGWPVFEQLLRPMLLGAGAPGGAVARATRGDHAGAAAFEALWCSAVTMLLASLAGRPADGGETRTAHRALVVHHIDEHLADPGLTPESIARALGYSRRGLYGVLGGDGPVGRLILQRRLDRALVLLRDPARHGTPIGEIGAEVGLPSPSHFSRVYRTAFGERPSETRAAAWPG